MKVFCSTEPRWCSLDADVSVDASSLVQTPAQYRHTFVFVIFLSWKKRKIASKQVMVNVDELAGVPHPMRDTIGGVKREGEGINCSSDCTVVADQKTRGVRNAILVGKKKNVCLSKNTEYHGCVRLSTPCLFKEGSIDSFWCRLGQRV